jgi:hypothetical protein
MHYIKFIAENGVRTEPNNAAAANKLSLAYAARHAESLFPDPRLYVKDKQVQGKDVEILTHRFSTIMEFEAFQDDVTRRGEAAETEFLHQLYDGLVVETKELIARHAAEGKIVCPYIVAGSAGPVISPETFEPYMPFFIKYALIDA